MAETTQPTIIEKLSEMIDDHFQPIIDSTSGALEQQAVGETKDNLIVKIKKLFGEKVSTSETTSIFQVHAVMNFFFADHNISKYNLIRQAFPDIDIRDVHHLEEKLEECNHSLFRFIEKIDEEKRGVLIRYIMDNYNGVSIESIKKYYFA